MDAVLVQRNLANEKDTAQSMIDQKIQRMAATSRESEFVVPISHLLFGEVNFAALHPLNVTSIVTKEPSKITEVRGLPDSLHNLRVERQLLVEIKGLPRKLKTLHLDGNYFERIDVSELPHLKTLSLNNNRLKTVGNLPESLEELYVDNNQISRLDLDGLNKLRVLHCRNNRTLRIENIPASMVDLRVEEGNPLVVLDYAFLPSGPTSSDDKRARGTETEFVDSLHKYFKLKSKYEEDARAMREKVRLAATKRGFGEKQIRKAILAARPKCVNCKRQVRTIFKMKDNRLIAYCGDTREPCNLRIEIFKGQFESDGEFARQNREGLLDVKERIIRQKMDVLFNYSSEEDTVSKFKDLVEEYNLTAFLHKTDVEMREDKKFNAHKRELIKGKLKLIVDLKTTMNTHLSEYKETGNRDSLHTAMDIYIKEYAPEVHNLRMLRYSVMDMVIPPGGDAKDPLRVLNQSVAALRQLETLHGEVPKVLKYSTGVQAVAIEPSDDADMEGDDSVIPWTSSSQDDDE